MPTQNAIERMNEARQQVANCLKAGLALTNQDLRKILVQRELKPSTYTNLTAEIGTGLFRRKTKVLVAIRRVTIGGHRTNIFYNRELPDSQIDSAIEEVVNELWVQQYIRLPS